MPDPMILLNEIPNKPKFQNQDILIDESKGLPPIRLDSEYWGQQNEQYYDRYKNKHIVNGLVPKVYNLGTKPINLYLVPHSHLDPGWIETFEDYYKVKVRAILTNVVNELWTNSHKRFTWCETSFLKRFWYDQQVSQDTKDKLQSLLWEQKIEVVGGGWV